MTSLEFLLSVWPSTGFYVLATPFKPPNTDKWTYRHQTFATPQEAAAFVERNTHLNVFFGVHSLTARTVWNPSKVDYRTGLQGANETRTQANSHAAKCFYLDLDVGVSTARKVKYASQAEALAGLRVFCQTAQLPRPKIVSSGTGLHVYWLLTDEIPSITWREHARKLKALTVHHGLRADPSRTADSASVLRVVGTFNLKDSAAPQPVQGLADSQPIPTAKFIALLDAAIVRAGATIPTERASGMSSLAGLAGIDSNTEPTYSGPPTTLKAVVAACGIMREMVLARGNVSEPEWYHTINLVRFLEDGPRLSHKISEGHPNYTPADTDQKIFQLEAKAIQPTSCRKLAEVTGLEATCAACPFEGRVRSPIVAARYRDPAPTPVVTQMVGQVVHTAPIPDPPRPYTRMKGGGVSFLAKNKEGDEVHATIYDNDLYPLRRMTDAAAKTEQHMWRVTFPRGGPKDFVLDADALYDQRKFVVSIAHQGIYPSRANIPHLQGYMVAYIAALQRLADAEAQNTHLGWTREQESFILPDKVLGVDGSVKPGSLAVGAERSTVGVRQRGTLERQVELMQFYSHPSYTPNQFYMLASLASPLFYATDQYGVLINASGETGASKSTSLFAAGSFWGQPEIFVMDGNDGIMSPRARANRVQVLANLPVMVDEITKMERKEASSLVMSITQVGIPIKLEQNGTERKTVESFRSSICMTSANNSLHNLLSSDSSAATAGSMRVVEIMFREQLTHSKGQADDFLYAIKRNYGHIGQVFIAYVVANRDAVADRVRSMVREIDTAANIKGSERFWSAAAATVLVAGEIAFSLGLLSFPVAAIKHWFITQQIPYMRGVVVAEYSSPLGILADYLETITNDIVVLEPMQGMGNVITSNVVRGPRGALHGHYDTGEQVMWCLRKSFKDYCNRIGANSVAILEELHTPRLDTSNHVTRVVPAVQVRKVLGVGTQWAKAQSWCFSLSMAHPEISGVAGGLTQAQPRPPVPPGRPRLVVG